MQVYEKEKNVCISDIDINLRAKGFFETRNVKLKEKNVIFQLRL